MNMSAQSVYRKLRNFAGVAVPKATLRHHVVRISEEIRTLEWEDAEAEPPLVKRILVGFDGTGVPMMAREVEDATSKQADCAAKTREAKVIVCLTAEAGTRRPVSRGRIGTAGRSASALTADSVNRNSEFGARPKRVSLRSGLFVAEELTMLSDGVLWIQNVCEEILPGRNATFTLDLFHAFE